MPVASAGAQAVTGASAPTASSPGEQQALLEAASTGKPVVATAATTSSSTLTANPNGTLTLSQSLAPVRKLVGGKWRDLDATLVPVSGGGVAPDVSTDGLTLSAGGAGPLATMTSAGRSLALTLPLTLPKPTLSGSTATYANVLDGVDLEVTADTQGGFSDVLVVKSAVAAANPALASLKLATRATGLTIGADSGGNLTAADAWGHPVYTSTAARMWDSATPGSASSPAARLKSAAVTDPITGDKVDPASGLPVASSASGPGLGAHTAPIATKVTAGAITLTPDASLLTGSPVYPVFIDPTFIAPSAPTPLQSWTQTNSYYHSASYWKSSDLLRVGDQNWESPTFVARSFVQLSIPSKIVGAHIISSSLNFAEEWSPSCTAKGVQLWSTGPITSATTWDKPPTMLNQVGATATVAHGYDSSCPAKAVGFDISSAMTLAASPTKPLSALAFGLRASDETDEYGWKEFDHAVTYTTTYDHAPATPVAANMHTTPSTSCTGSTVGDGDVSLYTKATDPDGGTLGLGFSAVNHTGGAVLASSSTSTLTGPSGTTFVLKIPKATLEAAAGGKALQVDWKAQVSDFYYTSGWSPTCSFTFDPTRPGAPAINLPATSSSCPVTLPADPDSTDAPMVGTIGNTCVFSLSPAPGSPVVPSAYVYQLNGGSPHTLSASSGPISLVPNRFTNTLTVTSLSAGANYGDSDTLIFNSATPATAAGDEDLTGGGGPDVLAVGAKPQNGLPAGLWLATGQAGPGHTGNGHINASATDIGMYGSGISAGGATGTGSPADYSGAIAFSGLFTRDNLQDVLVYYPGGTHAGSGEILPGNGDGSALDDTSAQNISSGALADPNTGDNPIELANADNVTGDNSAGSTAYPDLIGISGDSTNGYVLSLYTGDTGTLGSYGGGQGSLNDALPLTTATPTGGADWNSWTITTTQVPGSGANAGTAMYLWNQATGDLYLWTALAYDNSTGVLGHTSHKIASNWNTGLTRTLQAADINGDGNPDLWSTAGDGTVTAHILTAGDGGFTGTPSADVLAPLAHAWDLDEQSTGGITSTTPATDQVGSLPLTATTADATWSTGDLFSPDVSLNTGVASTTGTLTTAAPALNLSSSFSVSVWAKPNTLGGIVLSQSGVHASGLTLYPDKTTKDWYACMAPTDVAKPAYDCVRGSAVDLGAWTHLAVTYSSGNGHLSLYVNGVEANWGTHTAVGSTLFRGDLVVGGYRYNDAATGYFDGGVSQLQTWNQVLTPYQVAGVINQPDFLSFPSDGAPYPSGSNWRRGAAVMSFDQGRLSVTVAGTPLFTKGTATSPNAVLVFQTDGNLVAYPTAADAAAGTAALWGMGTNYGTGEILLFQADGNLVIYGSDGSTLWASATSFPNANQWQLTSAQGGADAAGLNPGAATGVTWGANHAGLANAAAVFNGTTSLVQAAAPAVDSTSSYTISCWVKLNALATVQMALGQGSVNHQSFYLGYNAGWTFQTTTTDTPTTTYVSITTPGTAATWTHLAGVYNADTHTMTLYVNGVAKGTATNTTPVYSPGGPLTIGGIRVANGGTLYNQVAGSISDVRTYNAAMTASQVLAIYNS
ncbi:LamG-like jellyroll fold domain-containing protein [Streptacidiphilus sp. N1-3]|uniref:LamG-like jellyroll fold domain-containing protein n=1 Tax=Streptacidiphilus alkalitolerans TaxID=3342712 RepID=A0ABV6XAI6_9ACTN